MESESEDEVESRYYEERPEKCEDPNSPRMIAHRLKYCPEECYSDEDIEIAYIVESAL